VRVAAERLDRLGQRAPVGEHLEDVTVVKGVGAAPAVGAPYRAGLISVSSQVSQVPHGVGPPAQLTAVPEMPTHSPKLRPCRSVSITVQPPPASAPASYTVPTTCGTPSAEPADSSWFWISRSRPRPASKTAVPSWFDGVGSPDRNVVRPASVTTL
jgi:hypothetical protein